MIWPRNVSRNVPETVGAVEWCRVRRDKGTESRHRRHGRSRRRLVGLVAGGALVASRQPRNPIGWIFCIQGLAFSLLALSDTYARYALVEHPGSLPSGVIVALFSNLLWLPASALGFLLLLLVFPTGRLLSGRWRVWVVLAIGGTVFGMAQVGLTPGELYGYTSPPNPFGIPGTRSLLDAVGLVGVLLLALSLVASIVSLILRFRRSRGTERQQIKWLLYDAVLVALAVPAFVLYEGECYPGCTYQSCCLLFW